MIEESSNHPDPEFLDKALARVRMRSESRGKMIQQEFGLPSEGEKVANTIHRIQLGVDTAPEMVDPNIEQKLYKRIENEIGSDLQRSARLRAFVRGSSSSAEVICQAYGLPDQVRLRVLGEIYKGFFEVENID